LPQLDKPEFYFGFGKTTKEDFNFILPKYHQKRLLLKQYLFRIIPKQYREQNKALS